MYLEPGLFQGRSQQVQLLTDKSTWSCFSGCSYSCHNLPHFDGKGSAGLGECHRRVSRNGLLGCVG